MNNYNNRLVREIARNKKAHRHASRRNPHKSGRIALLLCDLMAEMEEK